MTTEHLRAALEAAYIKGATDVHTWVKEHGLPNGDPEFEESAKDYAASALDPFDSAVPTTLAANQHDQIGGVFADQPGMLAAHQAEAGEGLSDATRRMEKILGAKFERGIPTGMVPWHGGDKAPEDWDGGPVLVRGSHHNSRMEWTHSGGPSDIIAYTARSGDGAR